ncbi:HYR domain-containing protein [Microbacterium trichothecenolyticum]|uniref:HYR domain-containing protein n=1 Tax=Microbacterium ureisolvens TaxID=2781186 RepID=A0ABS7I3H7_9MICO|nr:MULTISPECIES: HYR domain-containing protein [Microbacterium]MBW9111043.1 HYR domain-containing protein [Microbacterium ureisolvens]MBW9121991.1 HYR domain-containing protein [Microbacterium trichothecenolyticum]
MPSKKPFIRSSASGEATRAPRRWRAPRALAVVVASALAVFAIPGVAHADIVTNTVTAAGENVMFAGDTTSIGYVITNVNINGGDTQNSCNPASDGSSATLTVNVPAGVTVTPASQVYSACGTARYFEFGSNTVGTYSITVTVSDTGTGTYNTAPAAFTLTVKAPVVVNTAPTVAVTGVTNGASYEFGNVPAAVCDVTDKEDGSSSFDASLSTLAGPRAAEGLGSQTASCDHTDAGGLNAKASASYSIVDTTTPLVTVAAPSAKEATGALTPVTFTASAHDAVDGDTAVACKTEEGTSYASGDAFPVGTTTLICSATDKAGNTGVSDSFDVVVNDTTAPEVKTSSNLVVGNDVATVTYDAATAMDLVDGAVSATCTPESGTAFALGTTTVTCSATDKAGNEGSATFTVEVQDVTKPIVTVPANLSVEASAANGATVTYGGVSAVDDVDGDVEVTCTAASGTVFALGDTTVTCSASDKAGNTGKNSFIVTVADTTAPTVKVPADIAAEATSGTGAVVTFSASASDVVDGDMQATCAPASGSKFALGKTVVICSAIDAAGNPADKSFSITVSDTTAPDVKVPADVTAEATDPDGAQVTYGDASALDIVDGSITPTCAPASNSTFKLGATTVTCTATDAAGNTGEAEFTVTVRDTTKPEVNAPANLVVGNTSPLGAAGVVYGGATAHDLVSGDLPVTCTPPSGSFFGLGVNTVTCSAEDGAGNVGSAEFTIEVQDQTKPIVTVPADIVKEATGANGATVSYFGVGATDDVDGPLTPICSTASGTVFPLGTTTVTCSATDKAGNKGDNTFTVTVVDTTTPTVTVPDDRSATATSADGAAVAYAAPTASDIVDGSVAASCDKPSGSVFPLGTTTVTCTATDNAGNTGEKSFTVTVTAAWSHVLQPINANGSSIFKLGSTVPVKFTLTGASAGISNLVARLYVARMTGAAAGTEVEAISTAAATTGNLFRYDATAGQYIFNLGTKTLSAGTYQLRIDLGDGETHTVKITLR